MLSRLSVAASVLAGASIAACSATTSTGPASTDAPYEARMAAQCTATADALAALAEPDDAATVAAFSASAAEILRDEAEVMRDLDPPDDLADDHRAFVANTDEQADTWSEIARIADTEPDRIGELRTTVAQLTLGRDDLSTEMGLPDCVRGDN